MTVAARRITIDRPLHFACPVHFNVDTDSIIAEKYYLFNFKVYTKSINAEK